MHTFSEEDTWRLGKPLSLQQINVIETNRLNDLHCLDLVTMQWSLVMADTGTEVIFAVYDIDVTLSAYRRKPFHSMPIEILKKLQKL